MMRVLFVDDCKPEPSGVTGVDRTYDDAVRLLRTYNWDILMLDHDLGDDGRTGYDLLKQMDEEGRVPPIVQCVSWNPVGRRRIEQLAAEIAARPDAGGTRDA